MGGQFDYCGLWLDSAYGDGHSSESCTTYRWYNRLSKEKDFRIKSLEVWAVGEKPLSSEELVCNRLYKLCIEFNIIYNVSLRF